MVAPDGRGEVWGIVDASANARCACVELQRLTQNPSSRIGKPPAKESSKWDNIAIL
jgi:hypothetical protein